jgi:hypothetical protein
MVTITFSSNETGNAALYLTTLGGCGESTHGLHGLNGVTSMRKKKTGIRIEKEARRRARAGIGMPPVERLIPDKRRKPPKHKKSLQDSNRA